MDVLEEVSSHRAPEKFHGGLLTWNFTTNYQGASATMSTWASLQWETAKAWCKNVFCPLGLKEVLLEATFSYNADQFVLLLINSYLDEMTVSQPVTYGAKPVRLGSDQCEKNKEEVARVLESRGLFAPDALKETWGKYFSLVREQAENEEGDSSVTMNVSHHLVEPHLEEESAGPPFEEMAESDMLQGCFDCLWERVGLPFFPELTRSLTFKFEQELCASIRQAEWMRALKATHDVLVIHRLVLRLVSWYCGKLHALIHEARGDVHKTLRDAKESSVYHLIVLKDLQGSLSIGNKAAGCYELLKSCDALGDLAASANMQVCRELAVSATVFGNATISEGQFETFAAEVSAAASTSQAFDFARNLIQGKEHMHGRLLVQLRVALGHRQGRRAEPGPPEEGTCAQSPRGPRGSSSIEEPAALNARRELGRTNSGKGTSDKKVAKSGKCPNGAAACKLCAQGSTEPCKLSAFFAEILTGRHRKQVKNILAWWAELEAEQSFSWS